MRNISISHFIDIKEICYKYNMSLNGIVDISIGYDEKIYILISEKIPERIKGMFVNTKANTKYHLIILTVNWWENGELLFDEIIHLGVHEMNYHFVQPMEDQILLLGARCLYQEPQPEQNAVIVTKEGKVCKKMCLGDGIQQ